LNTNLFGHMSTSLKIWQTANHAMYPRRIWTSPLEKAQHHNKLKITTTALCKSVTQDHPKMLYIHLVRYQIIKHILREYTDNL